MIVLGIDPGNVRTGFGIIKKTGSTFIHIKSGLLPIPETRDHGNQLLAIERGLEELIDETGPGLVGLERIFFTKNKKTGIFVAQARGIVMKVLSSRGLSVVELSPSSIKSAITGDGRADKTAVAKMVGLFLKIGATDLIDDATDALAIAIAASSIEPGRRMGG